MSRSSTAATPSCGGQCGRWSDSRRNVARSRRFTSPAADPAAAGSPRSSVGALTAVGLVFVWRRCAASGSDETPAFEPARGAVGRRLRADTAQRRSRTTTSPRRRDRAGSRALPAGRASGPRARRLVPYEPGKPVEEVQRELGLERVVKLASNEGPFGPFPAALEAIERSLAEAQPLPGRRLLPAARRARRAARRAASRR